MRAAAHLAFFVSIAAKLHAQVPARPSEQRAPYIDSIPGTLVRFEMVPVTGGTVTLPGTTTAIPVEPFFIGRTEVSWDLYDAFALSEPDSVERRGGADAIARPTRPYGAPDYGWGHAGYPVISVAHSAAEAFCAWLSSKTGKRYRLPTEAEWQHAARLADKPRDGPRDAVAWHAGNAAGTTHAVGSKQRDALGLHDLFGNVSEWVITAAGRPVARGGSFRDPAAVVGPAARAVQDDSWNERDPQLPKSRWWLSDGPFVGFRIVREP
jgi:formylglycine-generating enzyme required for sulfatase activity